MEAIGGVISFSVNGQVQQAKGEFTVIPSHRKKDAVIGSDGAIHGYTDEVVVPSIEGAITDRKALDIQALFDLSDAPAYVNFRNGKTFVLSGAAYAGEGTVKTKEGEIAIKLVGTRGEFTN